MVTSCAFGVGRQQKKRCRHAERQRGNAACKGIKSAFMRLFVHRITSVMPLLKPMRGKKSRTHRIHTKKQVTNPGRMWYTKDYKLVKKSDPGRRRSLAPAFVLFYRRCLTTNSIANRMPRLLAMLFVLLGLFCAAALPAHAEDYDTVLDRLSRLQALARDTRPVRPTRPTRSS